MELTLIVGALVLVTIAIVGTVGYLIDRDEERVERKSPGASGPIA